MTTYDFEALTQQIVEEYAARRNGWSGLIRRRTEIAALVANRWGAVWPDELAASELPMVANVFRTTTEDLGRLFAEQDPTIRVYSKGAHDDDDAQRRENVVMGYGTASNYTDVSEYLGMDMVAAGYSATKCWPDQTKPYGGDRIPTFRRLNPLTTLPELTWSPDKPTDNVIVNYVETIEHLKATAPERAAALFERIGGNPVDALPSGTDLARMAGAGQQASQMYPTLEMVDMYCREYVARVACWTDPHRGTTNGVLMQFLENPSGMCPVQFAYRPTWGLEPLGQLDDAKGIVLTKNRYFSILLDYFIRMVYGGKLAWNVKNPTDIGPDTVYYGLGPDAKMEGVTPQIPSFQSTNIIGMLDSEGRSTAIAPAAREGEVDLNKASAAFLSKAQGQYTSVVRSLQRQHAICRRRLNETAIAMDETMCNWPKTLTGSARGRHFAVKYEPKALFDGDRANHVTYGTSSGLDAPTHNVINLQKAQTGMMSRETFLENDPSVEDVEAELSRLAEDRVRDAGLAMLLDPGLDPTSRIRAIRAFQERKSVEDVLEELAKQPPAAGMALSAQGAPVVPGGPSGTPGAEAPQQPTALPPPALLRAVGGRRPVPAGR